MLQKSKSWYSILPVAFKKLVKMGDQFAQDCLKAHNEYRRKHGAQPLVLDQTVILYCVSHTKYSIKSSQ